MGLSPCPLSTLCPHPALGEPDTFRWVPLQSIQTSLDCVPLLPSFSGSHQRNNQCSSGWGQGHFNSGADVCPCICKSLRPKDQYIFKKECNSQAVPHQPYLSCYFLLLWISQTIKHWPESENIFMDFRGVIKKWTILSIYHVVMYMTYTIVIR